MAIFLVNTEIIIAKANKLVSIPNAVINKIMYGSKIGGYMYILLSVYFIKFSSCIV